LRLQPGLFLHLFFFSSLLPSFLFPSVKQRN
jgi:hypothetical protein